MGSAPPIPATDWLPNDSETESLSLPDGRRLAYATYGDADGYPVLFCHGTPGSHVAARLLAAPARERGINLIAPDRPGIGNSEDAAVTFEDWPDDAANLLSHLDVDAAGAVGFSGGGAFALACHRLPEIERIALLGSSGPPSIGSTGRVQQFVGGCPDTLRGRSGDSSGCNDGSPSAGIRPTLSGSLPRRHRKQTPWQPTRWLGSSVRICSRRWHAVQAGSSASSDSSHSHGRLPSKTFQCRLLCFRDETTPTSPRRRGTPSHSGFRTLRLNRSTATISVR